MIICLYCAAERVDVTVRKDSHIVYLKIIEMLCKKNIIAFFVTVFTICSSCKEQKTNVKQQDLKENISVENNAAENDNINFFSEKYSSPFELVIDESNISDHPIQRYLDCSDEGYFTIHYIPKSKNLETFWENEFYSKIDFNTYDFSRDSPKIKKLIGDDSANYNIFAVWVKKQFLEKNNGCTVESIYLTRNAKADIFYYNNQTKIWKKLEDGILAEKLPPYYDSNYFTSQFPNLFLSQKNTVKEEQNTGQLHGSWAVDCENELTTLDINNETGFLSLDSNNAIYINLKVEKSSIKNEYNLKYASLSSQRVYYKDKLLVADDEISKEKTIGKLIIKNDGKAELIWTGLYNLKSQKLEFVANDFLLIRENGGKNPLILERCK